MLGERVLKQESLKAKELAQHQFEAGNSNFQYYQGIYWLLEWAMSDKMISLEQFIEENAERIGLK